MDNIKLKDRIIESHYGRNIDKAQLLLARWKNKEGYIPSEADWRGLCIKNYDDSPELIRNHRDISTLSATKDEVVKVILPYDNSGNRNLTNVAREAWSWINPQETLVNHGINLDMELSPQNKFIELKSVLKRRVSKFFSSDVSVS